MIPNKMPKVDSPLRSVHLDKSWRDEEARVMLSLFQGEYENSKGLSLPRRYKELERIITMFTSEPVLVKMKWLSEDGDGLEDSAEDFASSTEEDKDSTLLDDLVDEEENKDKTFNQALISEIKQFFSSLTVRSIIPAMISPQHTGSNTSIPSSCGSCESSNSVFSFPQVKSSPSLYSSDYNKSAPTTPPCPETSKQSSCQGWPLFKFRSEPFVGPSCSVSSSWRQTFSRNDSASTSSASPTHINMSSSASACGTVPKQRPRFRRNDLELCLIKKDEIPPFEIPPLRTTSPKKELVDTIIPSLYITSSSKPNSPQSKKVAGIFRISSSSPNIHRSFGHSSSCSDLESQDDGNRSSSRKLWNKLRRRISRDSRSLNLFNSCECQSATDNDSSTFDTEEAHRFLLEIKQEFEELSNWNLLSRYRKMKKMFKKGGRFASE